MSKIARNVESRLARGPELTIHCGGDATSRIAVAISGFGLPPPANANIVHRWLPVFSSRGSSSHEPAESSRHSSPIFSCCIRDGICRTQVRSPRSSSRYRRRGQLTGNSEVHNPLLPEWRSVSPGYVGYETGRSGGVSRTISADRDISSGSFPQRTSAATGSPGSSSGGDQFYRWICQHQ